MTRLVTVPTSLVSLRVSSDATSAETNVHKQIDFSVYFCIMTGIEKYLQCACAYVRVRVCVRMYMCVRVYVHIQNKRTFLLAVEWCGGRCT